MFVLPLLMATPARAAGVFVFGDSISDTGNGCLLPFLLQQQFPGSVDIPEDLADECRDARYYLGRITHGPVWAEVFASRLAGTPLFGATLHELAQDSIPIPFFPDEMLISSAPPAGIALLSGLDVALELFSGGANLAVAGAETEDLLGPDRSLDPLTSEVGAFLLFLESQFQPDPEDLYAIWIGGNDVRRQIKDSGTVDVELGVGRIIATILTLRNTVDARRFLVSNLPDVGLSMDLTDDQKELATFFTKQWNRTLDLALDAVVDLDVVRLDAFCLTDALIQHGKLDTESTCLDSNAYPECQGLLLFDDIHATAAVHRTFGLAAQAAVACGEAVPPTRFRRCVSRFTRRLVKQGLLAREGRRAINQCFGKTQHAIR